MKPERNGVEIVIAFVFAVLVMLLGMAMHADKRTFGIVAALAGAMIAVVVTGHLVALLADWLRAEVWPWYKERRRE